MNGDTERTLDAIVWRYRGKRYRECSREELWALADEIRRIGDREARRARELEQIRAHQLAVLDQFGAAVAEVIDTAEAIANRARP